jgi:hypothetical protein
MKKTLLTTIALACLGASVYASEWGGGGAFQGGGRRVGGPGKSLAELRIEEDEAAFKLARDRRLAAEAAAKRGPGGGGGRGGPGGGGGHGTPGFMPPAGSIPLGPRPMWLMPPMGMPGFLDDNNNSPRMYDRFGAPAGSQGFDPMTHRYWGINPRNGQAFW